MCIGSGRCISTILRRSKGRSQARRGKRLLQIADFMRLTTRAFKCSFSIAGKFEPIPPSFAALGEGGSGGEMNGGHLYRS
jgi:hypothetical protein